MYSRRDFKKINSSFKKYLKPRSGDAISCKLYECENAPGAATIEHPDGTTETHVAEACNVAGVIDSLGHILTLPRSNNAAEALSEVLLTRLDVLRENVRDLLPVDFLPETDMEKLILDWAGFLKHPRGFILAHRCFDDIDNHIVLDNNEITIFGTIKNKDRKDAAKDRFKNQPVHVVLPSVDQIGTFFLDCRKRIDFAIEKYK